MVGQCCTGHHPATEPCSRRAARIVERLGLVIVEQLNGDDATRGADRRVAQLQREARPIAIGLAGEVDPVLDGPRVQRRGLDLIALVRSEVAVARRLRQRSGTSGHQTLVGQVDVLIDQAGRRSVGVQMVDVGVDREAVCLLDDTEGEAIPFQSARSRSQHMVADLVLLHEAQRGRDELDAIGIVDGPTGDGISGHIESAVVGVMTTDVEIDRVGHRRHITPAVDVPGGHDQPRNVPSECLGVVRRTQMLLLLEAGRHRVRLGTGHDLATGRRCRPRRHRPAPRLPRTMGTDGDHCELLTMR